jgi:hypothetical protein
MSIIHGLDIQKGVKYYEYMRRRKKLPDDIRDYFVKMGRIGGLEGGRQRAENLTPERRREIAKKAVEARWAKKREG